ncbi:MAG: class A beta-lactamase [Pseudomonadota bacterium]
MERPGPGVFILLVTLGVTLLLAPPARPDSARNALAELTRQLERDHGARIGVAIVDAGGKERWSHRGDERFPLTSTFKPLACAAVLARVDSGSEQLDRRLPFSAADLVTYSPVTRNRVTTGISVAEACEAAITLSDNTAGNLLLSAIGGPAGLTAYLRELGDDRSRLDRIEPDLNEALPGDARDTTTPLAIVATLRTLLLGDALGADSRARLEQWMVNDRVADALFRAHLPAGWEIGDKTGAGDHGSRAIVALIRPPERIPVLAAVYVTETAADFPERNAMIASLGARIFDLIKESAPLR